MVDLAQHLLPRSLTVLILQLATLHFSHQNKSILATAKDDGHICGTMVGRTSEPLRLQALTIFKEDRLLVILNNWTATVPLDEVDILKGAVSLSGASADQLGRWSRLEWLRSTALGATAKKPSGALQALNLLDGVDGFIGVQYDSPGGTFTHQLISLTDGQEIKGDDAAGDTEQLQGKYGIVSDGRQKDVGASRSYVLRGNSFAAGGSAQVAWVPDPVLDRTNLQLNLPMTGHEQPPSPSYYAVTRSADEGVEPNSVAFSLIPKDASNGKSTVELPKVEELPVFGVIIRGSLHLAIGARQQVYIFNDPTFLFQALDHHEAKRSLRVAIVPFSKYFNCTGYDGPAVEDDEEEDGSANRGELPFGGLFGGLGALGLLLGLVLLLVLGISVYRGKSQMLSNRRKSNVLSGKGAGKNKESKGSNKKKAKGRGGHSSTGSTSKHSETQQNSSTPKARQKQQSMLNKTSWKWK